MKRTYNLSAILLITLTIFWSFSDSIPSISIEKEIKKHTGFSMDNALYHLKNISQKPHYTGSNEHKVVQEYIVNELKKIGLSPQIQQQTAINKKWKASTTVENILVRIKGTSAGKALLLLTHYDSNPHSSLGASDAGSGVVTILEGIRAFLAKNKQPKSDIIILFSDAEELGLLGAQAFVEHHPWAKDVDLVLNFEARGSGGPSLMLMETNGKNKKLLQEFMASKPKYPTSNSLLYSVYKILPNDTDLTVFRENGNINGYNFAFIDDHFDYHTEQDSYERLDRASLLHQAEYLMSSLAYFSSNDFTNLTSDEDFVFVNFPLIKLLSYPFTWIIPMLIFAIIIFFTIVFIGIKNHKISIAGSLKGFIPFTGALLISGFVSYFLWKLLLIIHPQYNDILHGFTYNGYQYIAAFSLLTVWILFKVYSYFNHNKTTDLLIAPIFFGLVINGFIAKFLPGAAFFIIPVLISILILSILVLMDIQKKSKALLFALLSIPTVYIIIPMVKLFPVGLGLKMLFISSILITLTYGWMLPVFIQQKRKSAWLFLSGLATIILFVSATFNSGFSVDKKKPNSLVFIQNSDTNTSYWATYNTTLDSYTQQIFSANYTEGNIPEISGKSKYNTRYKYYKQTANKNIPISKIQVNTDTIINDKREISFTLLPSRKINKYEFYNSTSLTIHGLCINGELYDNGKAFDATKGPLLIYQMSNSDSEVTITLTISKDEKPELILNEVSYDLLSNPIFNIQPRSEIMMPMPFVTNDAIITSKKIKF
ncbi:M20/M25/M40 family metallo-hydrolase [Tenacibaculum sp. TC6]|uniref:M20/M25/M40 family metallo-hydrolase n=1 Tax=Tenacibaculum sp. TC6 TaxID=3423223 RepID=UPI003D3628CF